MVTDMNLREHRRIPNRKVRPGILRRLPNQPRVQEWRNMYFKYGGNYTWWLKWSLIWVYMSIIYTQSRGSSLDSSPTVRSTYRVQTGRSVCFKYGGNCTCWLKWSLIWVYMSIIYTQSRGSSWGSSRIDRSTYRGHIGGGGNIAFKYTYLGKRRIYTVWLKSSLSGIDSPPKHPDIFKGDPRRVPKPLSNQFPVRVCACPLCILNLGFTRISNREVRPWILRSLPNQPIECKKERQTKLR